MNIKSITDTISAYPPVTSSDPSQAAAVLLLLADESPGLFLIVTKRPDTIATYAGDYCFPGGMQEKDETDLKMTVMREVQEELNISPSSYQFIGQLDDFFDRFDHLVRPYVATISKSNFEKELRISESEIEEIYYFPIEHLAKLEINPTLEALTGREPSYSYSHEKVFIWGLTASIMAHLGNVIFDLKKPIAKHRLQT